MPRGSGQRAGGVCGDDRVRHVIVRADHDEVVAQPYGVESVFLRGMGDGHHAGVTAHRQAIARQRGISLEASTMLDAAVDQAFGLLWYRMIFAHRPLDESAADDVAAALATQLSANQEG